MEQRKNENSYHVSINGGKMVELENEQNRNQNHQQETEDKSFLNDEESSK